MNRRKRFGEILVDAGVISESQLTDALATQKGSGKRLGQVLDEMKIVSERDISIVLARQFGYKTANNLAKFTFPPELLKLVDSEKALKSLIFPLKLEGKTLFLAMVNPLDMEVIDNLSFRTGLNITPCVTTPSEIQEAVTKHYLQAETVRSSDWWTILVVEDGELVRAAILAALKKIGYITLEASNGADGLKSASQNLPHLIITDSLMPRMDGNEMFDALQKNPATARIPVIALSARTSAEDEAALLDKGFFDFIAKPINPVRLTARVRRALKMTYGETYPAKK